MHKEIKKIFKYIFSAGTSFAIDLILFTIFNHIFVIAMGDKSILIATVIARVISSLYNYFMNSRFVFGAHDKNSIFKYYALVVIQMCASAILVYCMNFVFYNIDDTLIKIPVDVFLFVINYVVQNKLIFVKNE